MAGKKRAKKKEAQPEPEEEEADADEQHVSTGSMLGCYWVESLEGRSY